MGFAITKSIFKSRMNTLSEMSQTVNTVVFAGKIVSMSTVQLLHYDSVRIAISHRQMNEHG